MTAVGASGEVHVDVEKCMGSGNCVYWAPQVFDLDGGLAVVVGGVGDHRDKVVQAARMCPTSAITLTEPANDGSPAVVASSAESDSSGLIEVSHEPSGDRYVIRRGRTHIGHLDYRSDGDVLVLTHTEIDPHEQRKGFAGVLVAVALDDISRRGLRIVPECSYVSTFIDRNPGFADLVD